MQVTLVLGATCAKRVSVYHRLEHYLATLHRACRRKVEALEPKCPGPPEVIQALLDDRRWLDRMFADFESLLRDSDKFRT